jgi:hypothetical protein
MLVYITCNLTIPSLKWVSRNSFVIAGCLSFAQKAHTRRCSKLRRGWVGMRRFSYQDQRLSVGKDLRRMFAVGREANQLEGQRFVTQPDFFRL